MANSTLLTKVTLLLWIYLSRCICQAVSFEAKSPDVSLMSNIINYVQPNLQSLRAQDNVYKRSFRETNVEDAIDTKLQELMPLLQDDKAIRNGNEEDNLQEGDEETTIIEFITNNHPNDSAITMKGRSNGELMKPSIGKYKTMRNNIKLALERESVSKKTKKMVTETLDKMVTQLLSSQCDWHNDSKQLDQKTLRVNIWGSNVWNNTCYVNNIKLSEEECIKVIQKWSNTSKLQFIPNFDKFEDDFKDFNEMIKNKTSSLIDMFTKPVNFIREPSVHANKYKVRCSIIDADRKGRATERLKGKGSCDDFRLCSQELKEFLAEFYKSLNDTAVGVFTNYAAMYVRDDTTDGSEEMNSTTGVIHNASYVAAVRVRKVFMKQMAKLKLDSNNRKDMNVGAIKECIRSTVKHVNKNINKHLETDLGNLRAKILQTVKADLRINIGVDLGNLESHYLGKVCSFFVTCNGEVARSFRKSYSRDKNYLKSNSVYVKVQLTLDDELKDKIVKQHKELIISKKYGNSTAYDHVGDSGKDFNVKVTRTTMSNRHTEDTTTEISNTT